MDIWPSSHLLSYLSNYPVRLMVMAIWAGALDGPMEEVTVAWTLDYSKMGYYTV